VVHMITKKSCQSFATKVQFVAELVDWIGEIRRVDANNGTTRDDTHPATSGIRAP
jgi:hypothetical protein